MYHTLFGLQMEILIPYLGMVSDNEENSKINKYIKEAYLNNYLILAIT